MGFFWSGKHRSAVKGVCLVTLLYIDRKGVCLPVNFRVVDKAEAKNELFREMVRKVLGCGLQPALVSADSWYSGVENLKFSRKQGLAFSLAWRRTASSANASTSTCRWKLWRCPTVKVVHLRKFGFVTVFRTLDKNHEPRH